MQLTEVKNVSKFNHKKVESILLEENKFLSNLFSILPIKTNVQLEENGEEIKDSSKLPKPPNKTSRASSLIELKTRLQNRKSIKTYKEKLQKKGLKNKLKKKLKRDKIKSLIKKPKQEPSIKTENGDATNKPVFNAEDTLVFSKINFKGLGKDKHKKVESNPKKMLEKVQKHNEKVQDLKASGEVQKAIEIRDKTAWKNALAKSQGVKVKDDTVLLKKSIKKLEQKKRTSKKKWDARLDTVKKAKEGKQKKRTENIEKRKKDKKVNTLKKAAKKGRIIPGF